MNFKQLVALTGAVAGMTFAATAQAQQPTRGFLIEGGNVADKGVASVDLATNGDANGGGIRLGLGNSEVIFNSSKTTLNPLFCPSGASNYSGGGSGSGGGGTGGSSGDLNYCSGGSATDAVFKYGLNGMMGADNNVSMAIYGGLSYYDPDVGDQDYFNLLLGTAFTFKQDQLILNGDASFVIDDRIDENYLDIGLGAYFEVADTDYGTFAPGAEVLFSSLSDAETVFALGVRWQFNDRITLDLLPFVAAANNTISLPGQLRLNAVF